MEIGNKRGEKGFLRKNIVAFKLSEGVTGRDVKQNVSVQSEAQGSDHTYRDLGTVMFTFTVEDGLVEQESIPISTLFL